MNSRQFPANASFLIAVSGGVDSSVLCELCHQAELNFAIAHCNFQLRGTESERDEAFVRSLALKYKVPVWVRRFDTSAFADQNKISIQEAARVLRYEWFDHLRKENGFTSILTAHHADDNIETLLFNFFRGTGLQGLMAIPEEDKQERHLLRPLLRIRRKTILEFAAKHDLQWVEDSSNLLSKYTRNYFRNELIPALKHVFPQVEENLLQNIERFRKINVLYQEGVELIIDKIVIKNGDEWRIPVKKLLSFTETSLIYEVIRRFGFGEKQVPEVIKLCHSTSGKFIENQQYQIIRHRDWIIIAPKVYESKIIAIDKDVPEVRFAEGWLNLKTISRERFSMQQSSEIAQLDATKVSFPLILRPWKEGDYFYPLGMPKKKKLARFFIDLKLPKHQKERIWVLESHQRIIWVLGLRIDERFKVTEHTKKILTITLSSV
jgi:tRNA(Ile)-lysidine synthase